MPRAKVKRMKRRRDPLSNNEIGSGKINLRTQIMFTQLSLTIAVIMGVGIIDSAQRMVNIETKAKERLAGEAWSALRQVELGTEPTPTNGIEITVIQNGISAPAEHERGYIDPKGMITQENKSAIEGISFEANQNGITVRTAMTASEITNLQREILINTGRLILLMIAANLLATTGLGRDLSRDFEEISNIARQIADPHNDFKDTHDLRVPSGFSKEAHETSSALNAMIERMGEVHERQSRFMTSVAHEIRTPITAIKGSAELLERRSEMLSAEQRKELTQAIAQEARRLSQLVGNMLEVHRSQTTQATLSPTSLQEIIENARTVLKDSGNKLEIKSDVPWNIEVKTDAGRLRQILLNLFQNASRAGASEIKLETEIEEQLSLLVTDNGCGIPLEHQRKIFHPMHRIDDARTRDANSTEGAGLGLTISRELAKSIQVELRLRSSQPQKTQFEIRFPASIFKQHDIEEDFA